MRLVELSVPNDQREAVLDVLDDRGLGYTVTDETGRHPERSLLHVIVPADAVEAVLSDLREVGVDDSYYVVSVDAEFAVFEGIDEVQERWSRSPNRIASQALRAKAKDLRLNVRSYLWMMFLSTVVATGGLLLGSPAIVVGSMVIAPLVQPSLTAAVGGVRNDRDMLITSIHLQLLGLAVAIGGALVVSLGIRWLDLVPPTLALQAVEPIVGRISPNILTVFVGLAAGAAAAFGLATKGQVSLVGVMIAAALLPTAATVGIALAWLRPIAALGALLLLSLALLTVNLGGVGMLWYLGYRPDQVDESILTIDTLRQGALVVGTILFVLVATGAVSLAFANQAGFERSVNSAISDVDRRYPGLSAGEVSVEYSTAVLPSDPTNVTVTFVRTTNRSYPGLATEIERSIANRTGHDVRVLVRFVDYRLSEAVSRSTSKTHLGLPRWKPVRSESPTHAP